MKTSTFTALAAALLALALAASPAAAKKPRNLLWATVNVCDTLKHPNEMGVRARMPGNGTRQRMYTRFTAQYRDSEGRWRNIADSRTGWVRLGSAIPRFREVGFYFRFDRPKIGTVYLVRGSVEYQWRKRRRGGRGWRVVRRARRITTGGHRGTRDSDPKGYSAARCRIE